MSPEAMCRRAFEARPPALGLTAAEIDALMVDLKRQSNTTLIVVTHNIPSARVIGDELVFLHEGRIIAQGDADTLDKSDVPLVRQFMESQSSG